MCCDVLLVLIFGGSLTIVRLRNRTKPVPERPVEHPVTGASCPAKARSHGSQSELVMDLTWENIYELRAIEPIEPLQWQIGGYTPTTVPTWTHHELT